MKKTLGKLGGIALGVATNKVKESVGERIGEYKRKIRFVVWEVILFFFGILFIVFGAAFFLERFFAREIIFLFVGLLLILAGLAVRKNSK